MGKELTSLPLAELNGVKAGNSDGSADLDSGVPRDLGGPVGAQLPMGSDTKDPEFCCDWPIMWVSSQGHADVAEAGAKKDLQETRGRTVLELAAKRYAPFSLGAQADLSDLMGRDSPLGSLSSP
ncbi:hypothetical protein AK812_SmicGene22835 [Symbiodinium microadriaticum]|uniref:Uncharacterized protein n=1 Tax=Symbiodinium microadriaticum TaxID=2951 RepID=A0A1Q9DIV3_SYMMI|nr:hypothetical protein AK812_SmicGene22835 [Symbiodinium microadriaticum]CAE7887749.1 unnamed protein product [Symbiodinium sp. KB8]